MKQIVVAIMFTIAVSCPAFGQAKSNRTNEELLQLEKEFSQAIVKNDAEAVGRLLAADWVIVEPEGSVIDKASFLGTYQVWNSNPRSDGARRCHCAHLR